MVKKTCGDSYSLNVIRENVERILKSTERFYTLEKKLSEKTKDFLKLLPPRFKFYPATMTYVDTEHVDPRNPSPTSEKPISDLRSPRNIYFRSLDIPSQIILTRSIDAMMNASNQLESEFGVDAIDKVSMNIFSAIGSRKKAWGEKAEAIAGTWFINQFDSIVLSCNPLDILRKSSAMPWENMSCERYGGEFFVGVYSDIENSSIVGILVENKKPVARIMLGICKYAKVENGKVKQFYGFGIEKYYYTQGGRLLRRSKSLLTPRLSAISVTRKIELILESKQLYGYEQSCVTPYAYSGYSDIMHEGGTDIRYTKMMKKCSECGDFFSADIVFDGLCRDCGGEDE